MAPSEPHTPPAGRDPLGRRARAFDRVLTLLQLFGEKPEWGVREVSARLALPPSTVHSLLTELADVMLLERNAHGRYRLGDRAPLVGRALIEGFEPVAVALPTLEELAAVTGETVHLAALDGRYVVYEAKVEGHFAVRLASRVGQRFPAHATAAGKVLLAHRPELVAAVLAHGLDTITPSTITDPATFRRELDTIRQNGLATDLEEVEPGAACIAAPVEIAGIALHAISISGPVGRIELNARSLETHLRAAATRIGHTLSGDPTSKPPPPTPDR